MESELQHLKSSTSTSGDQVETLQSRISSLEASNRDTVALLESKSTANDKLAEELSAQHQKIIALRKEVSQLEEKNQAAENASISAKFREQRLQQEVELLRRNNDWHESELKTKSVEHTKFRKEKNARISELQRLNEDANSTIEAAKRTEATLRSRLDEVNQKAEDAYVRIQQLEEAATQVGESHRAEVNTTQRLADLQKQSADSARARLQEVQNQLDSMQESAANEISVLQSEMETERSERETAEQRIQELEMLVEKLEASGPPPNAQSRGPTSTPGRKSNGMGLFSTPKRAGSPAVGTPGGTSIRGGLTYTQIFSENAQLRSDLDTEKRRNERLSSTLDEMIRDLETKQPEIDELRVDHERLANELVAYSAMLEEATDERDAAKNEARRWEGQIEGFHRESEILRQQLRDLSRQISVLLMVAQARDQGLEALSEAQQAQLDSLIRGGGDASGLDESATAQFISQHLVIFKNASELQQQNMKQLRMLRKLGEQMEGDEAKAKRDQQEKDQRELEGLRERVATYEHEVASLNTRMQAFMRERDSYRRMALSREHATADSDMASNFGQSINGGAASSPPGGESQSIESPGAKQLADYAKFVKELQSHFDAYKEESATTQATLKQQLDQVTKEKSELQGQNARNSSQLALAQERYNLLQSNLNGLQNENAELQKRYQAFTETAAKQDLKTQQAAEELVEAKALADSLRNETSNLKAERELWKRIEARMTEDNQSLMDERSRLNKMITDLQNLQNERELTDSENRRRLQSRVDSLESELSQTKRKLDSEVEDSKKATLRREYESDQNRTRIDDLLKSLSSVKEQLVAAQTQRDQLQARVDEMKVELRSAEERATALQPRPTPRAGAPSSTDATEASEGALSREQELGVEISELRRDLEIARNELESAKAQTEQYRQISQAAEEELNSLNETNDQYREEMDRVVAEKDKIISDLEQRVNDISSELETSNNELSSLRTSQEEVSSKFNEQKSILESEVARLKDESERYAEKAKAHQADLKVQAEIAQDAQNNYENELVKHAEAAKQLQQVRSEYNQLKTERAQIKAEAEGAKATLLQSEDSWSDARARYEQEMADLRARREDVANQNKLLHQQLESVSIQIASLKQSRTSNGTDGEAGSPAPGSDSSQEIIRYLRQEKEIVDVQYELSIQEANRLKQQLLKAQNQLEETRERLNQERQAHSDKAQSVLGESELTRRINELNLFRESNATLRNENSRYQAQLATKTQEAEDLLAQIQPLQTKLREVENDLETKEAEYKLLQEDRDRWQKRTQDILQKYDRVDPQELEDLRTSIANLEKERDVLLAEKKPLQEQIDGIPAQLEQARAESKKPLEDKIERMINQFKERSRMLSSQIKEKDAAIKQAQEENQTIQSERDQATQGLAQAKEELERANASAANANVTAQPTDTQMQNGVEEGQVDETAPTLSSEEKQTLEARVVTAETKAQEEAARATELEQQVTSLQGRIEGLEAKVSELEQEVEASSTAQPQQQDAGPQNLDAESMATLEKLRSDLATAQQEVETLREAANTASTNHDVAQISSGEAGPQQDAEKIAALKADLESKHAERMQQLEETFQRRTDGMKQTLTRKLTEGKEAIRQEKDRERETALEELRTLHSAEVERLNADHQKELATLQETAATWKSAAEAQPSSGAADASVSGEVSAPAVKAEAASTFDPSTLSDSQIKDLVHHNAAIKGIVANNIRTKLNHEREALIAKAKAEAMEEAKQTPRATEAPQAPQVNTEEIKQTLRAEVEASLKEAHQQELEELRQKGEKAKESAVSMEGKRTHVKLNMLENRAKGAQAKLDIIKQAAEQTPQRPVGEVWEIAKDAKPAPAQPKAEASTPTEQSSQSSQNLPQPGQQQMPAVAAQPSVAAHSALGRAPPVTGEAAGASGAASPASATAPSGLFSGASMGTASSPIAPQTSGFGQPSQPNLFTQAAQNNNIRVGSPSAQSQGQGSFGQPSTFGQPRPPSTGDFGGAVNALQSIRGGGASRGTGIPRGSGIPRGGAGGGRGGAQHPFANPNQPQQQLQGQNQNPFQPQQQVQGGSQLPRGGGNQRGNRGNFGGQGGRGGGGNKRPREDGGDDGGQMGANAGKRRRSPGGGIGRGG